MGTKRLMDAMLITGSEEHGMGKHMNLIDLLDYELCTSTADRVPEDAVSALVFRIHNAFHVLLMDANGNVIGTRSGRPVLVAPIGPNMCAGLE